MIRAFRIYICTVAVVFLFFAQGCGENDLPALNNTDKRFAAFYADYLMLSGVAVDEVDSVAVMGVRELDSLFAVHALTRKAFNERADRYRREPKLWKAVLLEVRNNLEQSDD